MEDNVKSSVEGGFAMQKYQKKKTHSGKEPLLERAETGGTFPGKGCGTPGNFHTDTAKV
uniref:hypothetical protein n=1 Tax=Dysosmobacter welbionis TaxID=2093857 RepID=UPI003FEDF6D0